MIALLLASAAVASAYRHALIIVADDLGTDKVGAYASDVDNPSETRPATPTIDLLAGAGVRFSDAWAASTCSPTRAMLLTGEYPHRNMIGGVITSDSNNRLRISPLTLQQLAQDAGLTTALFGKWHLGSTMTTPTEVTSPFDGEEFVNRTGFHVYRGGMVETSYADWLYLQCEPEGTMSSGYVTWAEQRTASATDQTTSDALDWMEEQTSAGDRHLTVVAYQMPHSLGGEGGESWEDAVQVCGGTPTGDDLIDYGLTVACLDASIAELLAGAPELEDTLVIFLGDNGTPPSVAEGNFDDLRGKATPFENGIRVPLLVADGEALRVLLDAGGALPEGATYGIDTGVVVSEPVGVVDVYATVAGLLGLEPGTCTPGVDCARDSVSLASALIGGASARTSAWSEEFTASATSARGWGTVRIGDMKLIARTRSDVESCRTYEMYDLSVDRWETNDLYGEPAYTAEQAALLAVLEEKAAEMSGTKVDWLGYPDCCVDTESWYDGVDADCDGASDYDADADGFDALPYGGTDCDDADAAIYAGAVDVWYDGVDADCDGASDYDADADGFDALAYGGTDCDDADAAIYAGAVDVWYDGVDADCDGASDYDADADGLDALAYGGTDCDDGDASVYPSASDAWYDGVDADCDGASDYDADADGLDALAYGGTDCDDADAAIYAGAVDVWYDGVDADCDGASDYDADADGFDALAYGGTDCDDADAAIYAGAVDVWYDGVDADCDGASDYDADADGLDALAYGGTDCDDADAAIYAGAVDVWYDGVDADCDGASDYDADADGFDAAAYGGTDCDDGDASVYPSASDAWYDGVDADCDGASDYDADADGLDALAYGGTDCDDGDASVHPGAPDRADDGVDQDCDGVDASSEAPGCGGCAASARGPTAAGWLPLLALAALRRRRSA